MNRHQGHFPARNRLGIAARSRRTRPGLEPLEDRWVPAVFSVNSLADVLNPGPGVVTLRSAIQQANATPGGNTIDLTVTGTYKLTLAGTPGETDDAAGELAILPSGGDLTIANTSGGAVAVDGNHQSRVLDINPNFDPANPTPKFTVTLTGLTIENGLATDTANPDGPNASGGGIRDVGNASLTLNDVTVTHSSATADGGGIVFENTVSVPWTFTSDASTISDNSAGDAGGGVDVDGSGKVFINAGTVIAGNTCLNQGAGIWLDAIQAGTVFQTANLTVTGAIVRDNVAQAGLGGGIGNAGNGVVTIAGSTVADNSSGATGGGFGDENGQGTLIVQGSLFQGNAAVGDGGAIAVGGPSTTITGSELKGNSSGGAGGAIFANGTTLVVGGSTIARNVAAGNGGGVEIETTGTGGAGSAIAFTTIAANAALNSGGGVIGGGVDVGNAGPFSGALQLADDTINANFAVSGGGLAVASGGTVNIQNTLIAGNAVTNQGPDDVTVNNTHFTSQGGNLVGNNNGGDGGFTQGTDQVGSAAHPIDPLLGPLGDNGGPTVGAAGASLVLETEALLAGSPAIGKGLAPGVAGADGRGFAFTGNAPFDVGAFQAGAVAAGSMVSLSNSVTAPIAGQPLTFTATVTAQQAGSNKGTPIGTVAFTVDGTPAGSFAFNEAGTATLALPAGLSAGPHTIVAAYQGGGSYAASSTALPVTIGRIGTAVSLVDLASAPVAGQSLAIAATVAAPQGGTPAGTVVFTVDGATAGSLALNGSGTATLVLPAGLSAGSHTILAAYQGGGNDAASSMTLAVPVGQAASVVNLATSATSVGLGLPVTLTATVAAAAPGIATATGVVNFLDGGTLLGSAPLVGGQAVFTTTMLGLGPHSLTATFAGNGNLTGGNAQAALTVTKATPTVSLVASTLNVRVGQPVTLVADVVGSAGPATGTVTLLDNGTPVATAQLNGGVAIFTTAKLRPGNNVFTVTYGGDGNDQPAATATGVDVILKKKGKAKRGIAKHRRPPQFVGFHGASRGEVGPQAGSSLDRVLGGAPRRG